tara:strand:- start:89 stop:2005 length:1917 start_codon:yes stop_codon:yes gene_type:complete
MIEKIKNLILKQKYKHAEKLIESSKDKDTPHYLYYLSFIKNKLNKKKEALKILNNLIKVQPNFIEAFFLLANVNEDLREYDKAEEILKNLILKNPKNWKARFNLARIYELYKKNMVQALKEYKTTLDYNSNNNMIYNSIGRLQNKLDLYEDAIKTYNEALRKFPSNINNYIQLTKLQLDTGLIDLCEQTIIKVSEFNKNQRLLNILASCYLKQLRFDEAKNLLQRILKFKLLNFEEEIAFKKLLLLFSYREDYDYKKIHSMIDDYVALFKDKKFTSNKLKKYTNSKKRIGFVSSDFRKHSINNVIHSLFANRDKNIFEFYCYSSSPYEDKISEWYKKKVNSWKSIYNLNDKQASDLIVSDKIDILIFVGGFTGDNRYLLSTYKSAPNQGSFHPITTSNIKELDFLVSDNVLNPINMKEKNSENIFRMNSLFNFSKPIEKFYPKVNNLPMKKNNFISFCSFNNPSKISYTSLKLWSEVLNNYKNSIIYFKYFNFFDNDVIKRNIYNFFQKNNIKKNRIIFISDHKSHYLKNYYNVDIALDTFPYSGATTTFNSICMGVPVITLTGKNYISRQSASVLNAVNLKEWIVGDKNKYIAQLKKLTNINNLSKLRSELRDKVKKSILCNEILFYKDFERILKKI